MSSKIVYLAVICVYFMHQAIALSYINEIELNGLAEPIRTHRTRRMPPHNGRRFLSVPCCNTTLSEMQEEHWNQVRDFKHECGQELNVDMKSRTPENFHCMMNCVLKKLDILDDSNKLNEANFRNITKIAIPSEFETSIDDTISKCIESTPVDSEDDQSTCSFHPMKIGMCIRKQLLDMCPDELKDKSPHCMQKPDNADKLDD